MQLKPIAAIAVLLLMVASLSVSGCTTSETNQTPSASATPSAATRNETAQHDAFLEKYLAAYKNESYSNSSMRVTAWDLRWVNSTSARLQMTILLGPTNTTYNYESTYVAFPTPQDATSYLNAINKTAYSLASTEYESGGSYQRVTGHAPQIYKEYVYNEINPSNFSEYRLHQIKQEDNLVLTAAGRVVV